jgi:hypothetical protein
LRLRRPPPASPPAHSLPYRLSLSLALFAPAQKTNRFSFERNRHI